MGREQAWGAVSSIWEEPDVRGLQEPPRWSNRSVPGQKQAPLSYKADEVAQKTVEGACEAALEAGSWG